MTCFVITNDLVAMYTSLLCIQIVYIEEVQKVVEVLGCLEPVYSNSVINNYTCNN